MAQNTQSELVAHLRFLAGQNTTSLTTADAVTLLNYAIDDYSYIAMTADGLWQVDDTEDSGVSRATASLTANQNSISLNIEHLQISFIELEDSDGNKYRLEPYDLRKSKHTTPDTTSTSKPTRYDYYGGVLYFDSFTDAAYTIRMFYTRPFNHLTDAGTTTEVGIPSIHSEYLVLHALARLGLRTADENRVQVRQEVDLFEERIRDFYSHRDEDNEERMNIVTQLIS